MANPSKKGSGDDRFSAIQTDPRFQLPKKKSIRGEVDSRFKDALENDDSFARKTRIDKYGRKVKDKDTKKELSRYYNFDEDDSGREPVKRGSETQAGSRVPESIEVDSNDYENSDFTIKSRKRPNMRELMRGEGQLSSSSDGSESDSDSDAESDSDSDFTEEEEELEDEYETVRTTSNSAVPQGEESRRLAVVNLDWDNVSSVDLMATLSSFVPKTRRIVSVQIYPSEFGKKQMALEEVNGPAQNLFPEQSKSKISRNERNQANVDDLDDDRDYSSSKLRKYQLQRLQYYYAVVNCDSVETASEIYTSVDGAEYESTANFFDLRFIPDEVDFSGDKPRDECSKVPVNYQPSSFTTDALQHSKVKLSWDETPKERAKLAQKAFSNHDGDDDNLKAYLASDSESEGDEESLAERYRALIGGSDAKSKSTAFGFDSVNDDEEAVEITFNPVLEGKEAKLEIVDGDKNDSADPTENLSTIEQYRLKEKKRRLRRMENYKARKAAETEDQEKDAKTQQAELELVAMDDEYNEPQENKELEKPKRKMTKQKMKKKALEEAEKDFDTADPRFQALYEDPDFAIDSTLPQFKKTKGMERIIDERRKRQDDAVQNENTRFGKFKRKQSSQPQSGESIELLASKLRRKNRD